jgi:hypothetical protein
MRKQQPTRQGRFDAIESEDMESDVHDCQAFAHSKTWVNYGQLQQQPTTTKAWLPLKMTAIVDMMGSPQSLSIEYYLSKNCYNTCIDCCPFVLVGHCHCLMATWA